MQRFQHAGGAEPLDAVLVATTGCGHTLKAYGEILGDKPFLRLSVQDVHEFLAKQG